MKPTAVVLAGGIGKRFLPFIQDKTLFPFFGQSLLERTLRMVEKAGITQVIVATNPYNQPWLEANLHRFPTLRIKQVSQSQPNGMGDALLTLRQYLPENDIVVMNAGDMVESHLLPELLNRCQGQLAVLTGLTTPEYQPLGYFVLEGERVVGIQEKPGADNMPSNLANLVFHYFAKPLDFVDLIAQAQSHSQAGADDVYEQALNELMRSGGVEVYRYTGLWQKLKFGFHVLDMTEYFLKQVRRQISSEAFIAPTAVINGEVIVEAGARILDGAVLQGPVYIGANTTIGNGALVRQSIIEAETTVGYGSEIVRSYIGRGCDLHHAYLGDSILESKVHFGYGAHTANFRFDHEPIAVKQFTGELPSGKVKLGALIANNSEVGVNATLLPGVTIGTNTLIYPGTIVRDAVPDSHILKWRQAQELSRKQPKHV